jgi:hypothetical protein
VAQLILTCQVNTSTALMKMLNNKMFGTITYHSAQLGLFLTSKSLSTEQMLLTNQPLHHQFILQAVKDPE